MLPSDDLRPAVGVALTGDGKVVDHRLVRDSMGRSHGLFCLTIQGVSRLPDIQAWAAMLPDTATVQMTAPHVQFTNRLLIYYRFARLDD